MGKKRRRRKKERPAFQKLDEGELCRRFVGAAWRQLAEISYQRALDGDRGIFLFDLAEIEILAEDEVKADAEFLTFGHTASASLDGYSLDPLREAATLYDPEREIAVAVLFPSGKCISFIHSQQPSPAEIFLAGITTRRRSSADRSSAARASAINN